MDQRYTFTGPDEIRPHIVKFLQDILDGKIYVRELLHKRELELQRDTPYPRDTYPVVAQWLEPTGEETFTFEIVRPRQ